MWLLGRIREMAPRCHALMRTGLVGVALVVVKAARVAGVGIIYREE